MTPNEMNLAISIVQLILEKGPDIVMKFGNMFPGEWKVTIEMVRALNSPKDPETYFENKNV